MTIRHRKRPPQSEENNGVNEPALQVECDSCGSDLTHSVRIRCADPVCDADAIDICPDCFCKGKEFGKHKRGHPYRVVEKHSYPIFTEDWGADEELMLLEGLTASGLGNWAAVADHIGTRTKEEIEEHYHQVYIDSPNFPLPVMDVEFDIDPEVFQQNKRRRIEKMSENPPLPPPQTVASVPTNHEINGFMPGRLEFEHEVENEAEDCIKDLEFGLVYEWGGGDQPEDPQDVKAREEAMRSRREAMVKQEKREYSVNGFHDTDGDEDKGNGDGDDPTPMPDPIETKESLDVKFALLEMYQERVMKRLEAKAIVFERGLLDYRKWQQNEKKRPKEEREFVQKYKPLAKVQTAEDHEMFLDGLLHEQALRRRITELQDMRRLGITSFLDAEQYERARQSRTQGFRIPLRDYTSVSARNGIRNVPDSQKRVTSGTADINGKTRETTTPAGKAPSRRPPAPLNLANSPGLHLLTPAEQTLCSQLRILPQPYLVVKETLVREYIRRGGNLKRRDARDLVKIDVNKTSRIWDFLVKVGLLKMPIGSEEMNVDAFAGLGHNAMHAALPPTNGQTPSASAPSATANGVSAPPSNQLPSQHQFTFAPPTA